MKTLLMALCLLCSFDNLSTNHGPSVGYEKVVEEYPLLDFERKNKMGVVTAKGIEGVEIITKVVKNGDKYEYTYKIVNTGRRTFLVSWSLPDLTVGLGSKEGNPVHLWRLKPGKSAEVKVLHKDPPVEHASLIRCYVKHDKAEYKEWYEKYNVTSEDPRYSFWVGSTVFGPVPAGLLNKEKK